MFNLLNDIYYSQCVFISTVILGTLFFLLESIMFNNIWQFSRSQVKCLSETLN